MGGRQGRGVWPVKQRFQEKWILNACGLQMPKDCFWTEELYILKTPAAIYRGWLAGCRCRCRCRSKSPCPPASGFGLRSGTTSGSVLPMRRFGSGTSQGCAHRPHQKKMIRRSAQTNPPQVDGRRSQRIIFFCRRGLRSPRHSTNPEERTRARVMHLDAAGRGGSGHSTHRSYLCGV